MMVTHVCVLCVCVVCVCVCVCVCALVKEGVCVLVLEVAKQSHSMSQ